MRSTRYESSSSSGRRGRYDGLQCSTVCSHRRCSLLHYAVQLLRRGEANVKLISSVGNDGTLSSQERTTRLNVMRNLATDLQQASRQFRDCQTVYFRSMAAQEQVGKQFALSDEADANNGRSVSLADAMDRGFTPHEIQELQLMERQANDREKEILRIAKSVNDLAVLFKVRRETDTEPASSNHAGPAPSASAETLIFLSLCVCFRCAAHRS